MEIMLIPAYQNQGDPGFYVCFVHIKKCYLGFYASMFSHCIQELFEPVFSKSKCGF